MIDTFPLPWLWIKEDHAASVMSYGSAALVLLSFSLGRRQTVPRSGSTQREGIVVVLHAGVGPIHH